MRISLGLALLALYFTSPSAIASESVAPIEKWECKEFYGSPDRPVLVTAYILEGREFGIISVAGVEHWASFKVAGFNRRWDFVLEGGSYQYSFLIEPNGNAAYYDFTKEDRAPPSAHMKCNQKSA